MEEISLGTYLRIMSDDIRNSGSYDFNAELDVINATYETMLRFRMNKTTDDKYDKLYNDLYAQFITLQNRAHRFSYIAKNPHLLYSITFKNLSQQLSLENLLMKLEVESSADEHERSLVKMFHYVWTSDLWKRADFDVAMQYITSDKLSVKDKSIFVAAVILACMEFFDAQKLMFLFDVYLEEEIQLNQRAMIGIVLICKISNRYIVHYPEIKARISLFHDDSEFVDDLFASFIMLQIESKAQEYKDLMINDILPTISKASKSMRKDLGLIEINSQEVPESDANDEDEDSEELELAEKKLRQMAELQQEGADIYLFTFSSMKYFPFFNEIAHWLYPFSVDDPSLGNVGSSMLEGDYQYLAALLNMGPFSNTDKYALCFVANSLPGNGRDLMCSQIEGQINEKADDPKSTLDHALSHKAKKKDVRKQFVYDLYRLYNQFRQGKQLVNPMELDDYETFTPECIPAFSEFLSYTDKTMELADFIMRQDFYQEALTLFGCVADSQKDNAAYYQKVGYCHQALGNLESAATNYEKADLIKGNSKWTLSHLANVYVKMNEYDKAIDIYRQLIAINPDSLKYLNRLSDILVKTERYDEALPTLQKIYYLDSSIDSNIANLITSYINLGKVEEAEKCLNNSTLPLRSLAIHQALLCLMRQDLRGAFDVLNTVGYDDDLNIEIEEEFDPYINSGVISKTDVLALLDALILQISL